MSAPRASAAAIAIALAVVIGFATPVRGLWARDLGPWWLPFVAWLPAVVALAWTARAPR
ncbi:MAG: hypothetical protein KBG48_13755 [Kofleriaceae bacterium]|nr:hypothetical protein [Kofleriaceae bacterium]MBP9168454.1 hypothetical protein [Kofleriaceae bacterium]MBP9858902.1 hypothetical protein [Kofleriaceae bacterium]